MCEVNQGLHYTSPVALEPFTGCVRTATSLVSSGPYFYNETKNYIDDMQHCLLHSITTGLMQLSHGMRFPTVLYATCKGSDPTAHTRSLIRAFASHLNILGISSY